jgi:hypothetical protein
MARRPSHHVTQVARWIGLDKSKTFVPIAQPLKVDRDKGWGRS